MRFSEFLNPQPKSIKESAKPKMPRDYRGRLENRLNEKTNKLLDKKTPTVADLAEKYKTSLLAVEQQLKKGIKVEMEHTNKHSVAREIALDHLGEDLHYYTKLAKMEKEVDECADDPDCDCDCDHENILKNNIEEGLKPSDPVEKWIAVFKKSVHPKFKNKTPAERERQARMAHYRAVQNKKPFEE